MRMLKKIIALLLIFILMFTNIGSIAFASDIDSVTTEKSLFLYRENGDGTITITGHESACSEELIIPSTINGCSVTHIGDSAFMGKENLVSVTLPNSIVEIGAFSFAGCFNLNKICFPDSLKVIGQQAFASCGFEKIVLPDTVASVGYGAFGGCENLVSLTLSAAMTEIPELMLSDYNSIKTLIVPSNVKKLSEMSIGTGIETIFIPKSVNSIDADCFFQCFKYACYEGSKEEWDKITIDSSNDTLLNGTIYYNSSHLHEFVSFVSKEATCKEPGTLKYNCTECDFFYTESLPLNSHAWIDSTSYIKEAATCGKNASYYKSCSVCECSSEGITDEYWVAENTKLEHTQWDWVELIKEPSCQEEGVYKCRCIDCNEVFNCYLDKKEHSYEATTKYLRSQGSCKTYATYFKECSLCGISSESIGEYWEDYNSKLEHHYEIESKLPSETCTTAGKGKFVCIDCGDYIFKSIPARGHELSEWTVETAATAFCEGVEIQTCLNCDYSKKRSIPILDNHNIIASGMCGESSYWKLNDEGVLTIGGSGAIENYKKTSKYGSSAPWSKYISDIKIIEILNGITRIGNYSFFYAENVEEIIFSDTVTEIGSYSFAELSNLKALLLPKNIVKIENNAFRSISRIEEIVIPTSCVEVGEYAFYLCHDIKTVYVFGKCTLGIHCFDWYESTATIYLAHSESDIMNIDGYEKKKWFDSGKLIYDCVEGAVLVTRFDITDIENKALLSTKVTQTPTVKYGNKILKENIDYKIRYANNDNLGTATMYITGIGNYSGTEAYTFSVLPAIKSVKNTKYGIEIVIKKYKNVEYYDVFRKKNSGFFVNKNFDEDLADDPDMDLLYSETDTSIILTDHNCSNGNKYTYKITAYIEEEDDSGYSHDIKLTSPTMVCYRVTAPKGLSIKKSYRALTLSYNDVSKVTGYEIFRKTSANGTYKKIKTTTNTVYKNSDLTAGEKYYYKIRAYRQIDDTKYYSNYIYISETVPKSTLNKKSVKMVKGGTTTLKLLYVKNTNGIKWSSTNKKVATVNSKGKVTAKGYGSCYVKAKQNGKTYKCKITVKRIYPGNLIMTYIGYNTRDNTFKLWINNCEKKSITIYSDDAYSLDADYTTFDRDLKLSGGKSSVTVKPGAEKYITFKVIGDTTWPIDSDHTIYFKFKLDEKIYWARVNAWNSKFKMNGKWYYTDRFI